MFTGIVTDVGRIENVTPLPKGIRIRVSTKYDTSSIDIGASIAHAGVCLTVVERQDNWFETEAWEEALRLSTLGKLKAGDLVNLERPLKMGDELGGHMVSGHVDGMGEVVRVQSEGDAKRYTIKAPSSLAKFIAPKGSVALNGTSLTVNSVDGSTFDVLLIKHSQEVTTWAAVEEGHMLNIEIDTLARYAARLTEFPAS